VIVVHRRLVEGHRQNVVHGGAGPADHFGARLRADHRQHGQARRVDRAPGIVLGFDAQDFGWLVAVDPDALPLPGVDQDLGAAGRPAFFASATGASGVVSHGDCCGSGCRATRARADHQPLGYYPKSGKKADLMFAQHMMGVLRALGEMAHRTQVIAFTHPRHLLELAAADLPQ
jgi:hypothetical protein